MPAMVVNCRSSTVATEEAMVFGLAPGRLAETIWSGNRRCGRSLTGARGRPPLRTRRLPPSGGWWQWDAE